MQRPPHVQGRLPDRRPITAEQHQHDTPASGTPKPHTANQIATPCVSAPTTRRTCVRGEFARRAPRLLRGGVAVGLRGLFVAIGLEALYPFPPTLSLHCPAPS